MNSTISRRLRFIRIIGVLIGALLLTAQAASAQTTKFTQQWQLTDPLNPLPDGIYEMQFRLFDDAVANNQIGATLTLDGLGANPPAVTVTNGVFTVQLDFGADVFPGADRYLEVAVKYSGQTTFTTLRPRQQVTSKPYAIRSLSAAAADTATTAANATMLDNVLASKYVQTADARLSDSRPPMPGSSSYIQNTTEAQPASSFHISNNGTVDGTLSGNTVNSETEYNLGGQRVLSSSGDNLFGGFGAGQTNSTGFHNSFFGWHAGQTNSTGDSNSFFGMSAGQRNSSGVANSFFGVAVGANNMSGAGNSFFGTTAGASNSTGDNNSFFGRSAGISNLSGKYNTIIGSGANVGSTGLFYATAIGANAVVGTDDTIVLGKAAGWYGSGAAFMQRPADTIRVPGNLYVNDTLGGSTVFGNNINAGNQYNIGGEPVLRAGLNNMVILGKDSSTTVVVNGLLAAPLLSVTNLNANTQVSLAGQPVLRLDTTTNPNVLHPPTTVIVGSDTGIVRVPDRLTVDGSYYIGGQQVLHADESYVYVGAGPASTVRVPGRFVSSGEIYVETLAAAGEKALCRNALHQIADCSSSLRYKTNIAPFASGLNFVRRLRPISFDWKTGGMHDVGFGAEEVAAINPLFVTYNSKGEVEGVKYDRLSVAFVNAFKEQQAQIERQQNQIKEQQNQLEALRKLVCRHHQNSAACR